MTLVGARPLSVEIRTKWRAPCLYRRADHGKRAEHVVEYALRRVGPDHGHVLVGGGMVDGVIDAPADAGHVRFVGHVGEQGHERVSVAALSCCAATAACSLWWMP